MNLQSVVSHYIPAHNLLNEHKNCFLHLIDCLVIVGFNQNKSNVNKPEFHNGGWPLHNFIHNLDKILNSEHEVFSHLF